MGATGMQGHGATIIVLLELQSDEVALAVGTHHVLYCK
jgi:hypothetical protein